MNVRLGSDLIWLVWIISHNHHLPTHLITTSLKWISNSLSAWFPREKKDLPSSEKRRCVNLAVFQSLCPWPWIMLCGVSISSHLSAVYFLWIRLKPLNVPFQANFPSTCLNHSVKIQLLWQVDFNAYPHWLSANPFYVIRNILFFYFQINSMWFFQKL